MFGSLPSHVTTGIRPKPSYMPKNGSVYCQAVSRYKCGRAFVGLVSFYDEDKCSVKILRNNRDNFILLVCKNGMKLIVGFVYINPGLNIHLFLKLKNNIKNFF